MWKAVVVLAVAALGYFAYAKWFQPRGAPSAAAAPAPAPNASEGRTLHQQGQWAQAAARLLEEASRAAAADAPDLLMLAADCHARLGHAAEAEKLWTRVAKDYAAHPLAAQAAARLGDTLAARGDKEGARASFAAAYQNPAADRDALARKMIDLNQELLFSKKPTRDAEVHTVQAGEVLVTIGRKWRVEPGLIKRVNGLKSATIYPNDKLKIPKGTFRIHIAKSHRMLRLLYDESVAKQYEVAIGSEGHETPAGEFSIAMKEANPTWTKTGEDGRQVVVRYGEPGHMLGTRWMGFADPHRDIGIHGTPKEEEGKIGGKVSKGCVRMRNAEVEELYDLVTRGTRVTVTE